MNSLLPIFGVLSGIIGLIAYPPYIRDMFKGTTRPARASWFIWMVLSGIALAGQIDAGATWSLLMTVANTIGVTTVFLLSLKFGHGGLHRRDIISLVVASCGLVLWALTDQPILALLFVIIVDAAGAWLTVVKAYQQPESETLITWWLDVASNSLGLLAVGALNVTLMAYPAYLLLANAAVVAAIYLGNKRKGGTYVRRPAS